MKNPRQLYEIFYFDIIAMEPRFSERIHISYHLRLRVSQKKVKSENKIQRDEV